MTVWLFKKIELNQVMEHVIMEAVCLARLGRPNEKLFLKYMQSIFYV